MDHKRELLRHLLATVAYRAGNSIKNAPATMATTRVGEGHWTGVEILSHIGDALNWGSSIARGDERWEQAPPGEWDAQVQRFHSTLESFDGFLATDEPMGAPAERLIQGPIADALTHVGQLATLRRLCGAPVPPENYFKADIGAGRFK